MLKACYPLQTKPQGKKRPRAKEKAAKEAKEESDDEADSEPTEAEIRQDTQERAYHRLSTTGHPQDR